MVDEEGRPSRPCDRAHHGIGVGYLYPHDFPGADVEQQYLPDKVKERRYYEPSDEGYERSIAERMGERRARRRTAEEGGR
jgi:putative ATPase